MNVGGSPTLASMIDPTPQERLALIAIALLLGGGAWARAVTAPTSAEVKYSAEPADTLNTSSARNLVRDVRREVALERVRDQPLAEGERIDPNSASVDQIDRLPGIGPSAAQKIVEARERGGRFRSTRDLLAVPGIGPATLDRIAPYLSLPADAARSPRPIDINGATREELTGLPGIGPAIASRIVAFREENGRFGDWEDLEKVVGIGPALRGRLELEARLGP